MIKKFLLFAFVMLPVVGFAQEAKIAYVNYSEVALAMPEYKQMVDSLQKKEQGFQTEMKSINDEYTKKYSDFISVQDTLDESIKIRRYQEIENIRVSAENFQQVAAQQMEELQQALIVPITNKLQKAVEEVGSENNLLYIIDSTALRYISQNAINATPLVKKRLGIQ
jgi:outer membrane protein